MLSKISFFIQNAVQGHHWVNCQEIMHPFAVYYRQGETVKCRSYCIISDSMMRLQSMHSFQLYCQTLKRKCQFISVMVQKVNTRIPRSSQICVSTSWTSSRITFFATTNGKSRCNSIGGTVKPFAARVTHWPVCRQQLQITFLHQAICLVGQARTLMAYMSSIRLVKTS